MKERSVCIWAPLGAKYLLSSTWEPYQKEGCSAQLPKWLKLCVTPQDPRLAEQFSWLAQSMKGGRDLAGKVNAEVKQVFCLYFLAGSLYRTQGTCSFHYIRSASIFNGPFWIEGVFRWVWQCCSCTVKSNVNFPAVFFWSVFLQFLFMKMQATKSIKQRCGELLAPVLNLAKPPVCHLSWVCHEFPDPSPLTCGALPFPSSSLDISISRDFSNSSLRALGALLFSKWIFRH